MKRYGDIDSKFRFVILASKRAKELLRGSKPKLKTESKNPIRIAQDEVSQNLIEYEITELPVEEDIEPEEEVFEEEELEKVSEESTEESEVKEEVNEKKVSEPAGKTKAGKKAEKSPKKKSK